MELMRLRRRLAIAVHGHDLLKEKLDGLMQFFIELVDKYRAERRKFDGEYAAVIKLFVLADITGSPEAISEALAQASGSLELSLSTKNILSVRAPHLEAKVQRGAGYSLLDTPLELDEAIRSLAAFLPRILELAELEQSIWLLMEEIERTRRRVNALEYIMIPSLRETIRFIQSKLDENERGNITRLMKIKDMRLAEEREKLRRPRAGV
jgi:V/A-type H+-transporting ATPase subunit D